MKQSRLLVLNFDVIFVLVIVNVVFVVKIADIVTRGEYLFSGFCSRRVVGSIV